jgi:hypothetical protein
MGLLIGCGVALRGPDGALVGVAGLDVTVPHLANEWVTPGDLDAEGFLVADDDRVIVRSRGEAGQPGEEAAFPWPDVLAAVRAEPAGQARIGEHFAAWSRLSAVDWTYVVVGAPEIAEGE